MTKAKKRGVVVTTEHRGVFFGYTDAPAGSDPVTLEKARMCVYWSADLRGFMGLASHGPNGSCKISRPVPLIDLRNVTAILEMTHEAIDAWEADKWS